MCVYMLTHCCCCSVTKSYATLWGLMDCRTPQIFNGSISKESACKAGDPGSIPGSGRSPGKGNGNPLLHSCLENPLDRGAWRATQSMGSQKSWTQFNWTQHTKLTNQYLSSIHYSPTTPLDIWVYSKKQDKVFGFVNLLYGVGDSKQVKKNTSK